MPKGAYRARLTAAARSSRRSDALEAPTIAVMPFDNFAQPPEDDYFSDGIAEDLITDLSRVSGLQVVSRHSTFAYKGAWSKARDIYDDLGARYVLAGSVRRSGKRVRITAQLIDGDSERQLWSGRYDRDLEDIFAIQDEVSKSIAVALQLQVSLNPAKPKGAGAESLEAHDLLLRARDQFYRFDREGLLAATELVTRAVALDPNYAQAHAWQARCLTILLLAGLKTSKERTIVPALRAAQRAVELDPELPVAHAKVGWTLMWSRRIEEALQSTQRAVELAPTSSIVQMLRSLVLSSAGRGEEALVAIETSMRLDPYYTVTHLIALGLAYFAAARYEQALIHIDRGLQRNPNFVFSHLIRGATLGEMERFEEARAAIDRLRARGDAARVRAEAFFFNDADTFRRFDDGLTKAGLPPTP